jgi:hypothetical protein
MKALNLILAAICAMAFTSCQTHVYHPAPKKVYKPTAKKVYSSSPENFEHTPGIR